MGGRETTTGRMVILAKRIGRASGVTMPSPLSYPCARDISSPSPLVDSFFLSRSDVASNHAIGTLPLSIGNLANLTSLYAYAILAFFISNLLSINTMPLKVWYFLQNSFWKFHS
jgi:hypothetical protein